MLNLDNLAGRLNDPRLHPELEQGGSAGADGGGGAKGESTGHLIDDIMWPRWFDVSGLRQDDYSLYFMVGGNGTGVPFHPHSDGFHSLLYGKKHW